MISTVFFSSLFNDFKTTFVRQHTQSVNEKDWNKQLVILYTQGRPKKFQPLKMGSPNEFKTQSYADCPAWK
jgi:hypothetical protein